MVDWPGILRSLQLTSRGALAIAIASGGALFLPTDVMARLGLDSSREDYAPALGIMFLISAATWLAHCLVSGASFVWRKSEEWRENAAYYAQLRTLSAAEARVLASYLAEDTKTRYFEIGNGVVEGLVSVKVLYRPSPIAAHLKTFAYNIHPRVWSYLRKHPELLSEMSSEEQN